MSGIKVRKYHDSVYIIYCHKNKKFKIFTGVKIEDKFWNLCAPKKNCYDYANVISPIAAMETRVLNASMAVRVKSTTFGDYQPSSRGLFAQYPSSSHH